MVRGCMADSFTVDGKEGMDLTDGERKKALKRIFGRLEPKDLTEVMKVLIERFGNCKNRRPTLCDLWRLCRYIYVEGLTDLFVQFAL